MYKLKKSSERGLTHWDWLESYHSFSFGEYYDPKCIHFRALRVINEDTVAAGKGFALHPHDNMEIITFVTEGILEHQDTLGNKTQIRPGEIQRMSAGKGIMHSEYNPSTTKSTHLLQIWILPEQKNLEPSYAQKNFSAKILQQNTVLLASKNGERDSITINQDVNLYWVRTPLGEKNKISLDKRRHQWIQAVKGQVRIGEYILEAGDALAISEENDVTFDGEKESEILLFDLA